MYSGVVLKYDYKRKLNIRDAKWLVQTNTVNQRQTARFHLSIMLQYFLKPSFLNYFKFTK